MKRLDQILKLITKRRALHTARFVRADFKAMELKDCDVKDLWRTYTLTAEGYRTAGKCFNCGKTPAGISYLIPVGKGQEEDKFCSEACREQFGILKGTT